MKPSLYLETTIPSFLVRDLSPILRSAAHQIATRRWWDLRRDEYELYVSSIVEDEIGQGNLALAEKRLALVADLPRLAVTDAVGALAAELHAYLHLPPVAKADAIHLALACHYEID